MCVCRVVTLELINRYKVCMVAILVSLWTKLEGAITPIVVVVLVDDG